MGDPALPEDVQAISERIRMSIGGLYTNDPDHGGSIADAIANFSKNCHSMNIASAFFTDDTLVHRLLEGGAMIRLIMRLGYPTHPKAIFSLLYENQVRMRFFTDHYFHPKLYLFDNEVALVGSANLTNAAFHVNQEIMVALYSNDPRLAELELLFRDYWDAAKVLTPFVAKEYAMLWTRNDKNTHGVDKLEADVVDKFGKISPKVIKRPGQKIRKSQRLYDSYKRDYQEVTSAFDIIRSVYESIGQRKVPESTIPLRLEVDSFISYVRDVFAKGGKWSSAALLQPKERETKIRSHVVQWHEIPWPYFEETIAHELYPELKSVFASPESIVAASDDELLGALIVLHSFLEHRRYELGGLEPFKKQFIKRNGRERINQTIIFLLFGPGDIEQRMCDCIYNPEYHLHNFGPSNVQEIVGWLNSQELPIINLRTRKVIRYFGFDIWGD